MKTLPSKIPPELFKELREIVCNSCDGVSAADTCDWRRMGKYCDVANETVCKIHECYYTYQAKELRKAGLQIEQNMERIRELIKNGQEDS